MEIKTQEIIKIIKATRDLTLPHFGNVEVKEYKSGSATDAVTEIDQTVEKFLKDELVMGIRPLFYKNLCRNFI